MGDLKKLLFLCVLFILISSIQVMAVTFIPSLSSDDGYIIGTSYTSDNVDGNDLWVDQTASFETRRSFIQYDISSIGSGSTIDTISFELTKHIGSTSNGAGTVDIIFISGNLENYTNNQLYDLINSTSSNKVSEAYPTPGNTLFSSLDSIKSAIQTELTSGDGIIIIGVKDSLESSSAKDIYFYDRNEAGKEPTLQITFTPASVDNVPTVTLLEPADGLQNNSDTINFTANVTDDGLVINCDFNTNFSGSFTETATQSGINDNETIIGFDTDVSGLSNGEYAWYVNCTDNATSPKTTQSSIFTFTRNILGATDSYPNVTLISPDNNDLGNTTIINFTARVQDDNNVTSCSLFINESGWNSKATQTVNSDDAIINFTIFGMTEGTYLWNIECTDNNTRSNFSDTNYTIVINNAPVLTLNTPLNDTQIISNAGVTFNFGYDSVDFCEVLVDGIQKGSGSSLGSNPFDFGPIAITAGAHVWNVRCNDSVGNWATSETRTLNAGTLIITNVNPVPNVNNSDTFQYEVQVDCTGYCGNVNVTLDPYPSSSLSFWQKILNFFRTITGMAAMNIVPENTGDPFYTLNTSSQICTNMNSNSCNIIWDVVANGSAGPYDFFAFANATENSSLSAQTTPTIQITINDQAPEITSITPSNSASKVEDTTITFQADVLDDYNISNCSFYSTIANGTNQRDDNQTINQQSTTYSYSKSISTPGNYNWSIQCTDDNSQMSTTGIMGLTVTQASTGGGGGGSGGGDDDDDEEVDLCDGVTCNDGDECTSDSCSEGSCQYNTISNCPDLCAGVTCDDNDECTSDSCSEGSCEYNEIDNCEEEECIGDDCEEEACIGDDCDDDDEEDDDDEDNDDDDNTGGNSNTDFFCNESEMLCDDFIADLMSNTHINLSKNVTYNNLTNQTEVQLAFVAEENLTNLEFYQSIPKCMAYYVHLVKFQNTDFEIIKDDPLIVWHFDTVTKGQTIDLSFEVLGKIPKECHELLKELYYEQQEQFAPSYKLAGIITAIFISVSLLLLGISKVDPKALFHKHQTNKEKIDNIDSEVNKLMKEVEK